MPMSVPASAGADARSSADGRAGANARAPGTTADANAGACGADADADADVRAGADALPSPCLVPMPICAVPFLALADALCRATTRACVVMPEPALPTRERCEVQGGERCEVTGNMRGVGT